MEVNQNKILFKKANYQWLISGLVLLVFGYWLMWGGKAQSINIFNYEVFSTVKLTIAPIVVIIGYLLVFVAILKQ